MKVANNSIVIGRNINFIIGETQIVFFIPNRNFFQPDFFFSVHNSSVKFTFPNKTELLEKLLKLEQKIQKVLKKEVQKQ